VQPLHLFTFVDEHGQWALGQTDRKADGCDAFKFAFTFTFALIGIGNGYANGKSGTYVHMYVRLAIMR